MSEQHYDIIGEVHGHADALRRLLIRLGYAEARGGAGGETRRCLSGWLMTKLGRRDGGTSLRYTELSRFRARLSDSRVKVNRQSPVA
jgi:hypothetical protein